MVEARIRNFPLGSDVWYTDAFGTNQTTLGVQSLNSEVVIQGTEAEIQAALATLTMQAPEHSSSDFFLLVTVVVDTTDEQDRETVSCGVTVHSVADPGLVAVAPLLALDQGTTAPLEITVTNRSADGETDESERIHIEIQVASNGTGPLGTLSVPGGLPSGLSFVLVGDSYELRTTVPLNAREQQELLETFLATDPIVFTPASDPGRFVDAIEVRLISTEQEPGDTVADDSYGGADGDSETETVAALVTVEIYPPSTGEKDSYRWDCLVLLLLF